MSGFWVKFRKWTDVVIFPELFGIAKKCEFCQKLELENVENVNLMKNQDLKLQKKMWILSKIRVWKNVILVKNQDFRLQKKCEFCQKSRF